MEEEINNQDLGEGHAALLLGNMTRHISLDPSEKRYVLRTFKEMRTPKKQNILEQGKLCRYFYFVESGSLRAFHTNARGKEATMMFAVQDWWITDMAAFVDGKPALISLETLEDCLLFSIDATALEQLLQKIPKMERYFRILFQRAYIREQLRVLNAISYSVEERYIHFLEKYPQIVEKVSQKQLASYLGITPEFLSTVKKNSTS
ncbi:MAG: Crp/Fnr family transcriptional regulator [Bacteroidota bacterium]